MSRLKRPMQNFGSTWVLACLAEQPSFTSVAATLGMTASGVSRSISRLEERLEIKLVNRTTRSVSLTRAGQRYAMECAKILRHMEQIEDDLLAEKESVRGHLKVQCTPGFGRQVMLPALPEFLNRYPDLDVELQLDGRHLDMVTEGIDMAIRFGVPKDSGLVARMVCDVYYGLYAAPSYLKKWPPITAMQDLEQHRCLAYSQPQTGLLRRWMLSIDGEDREAKLINMFLTNDMQATCEIAAAGAGIGYLPDFAVGKLIQSGALVPINPEWNFRGSKVYATYCRNPHGSHRVKAFLDFLLQTVGRLPVWQSPLDPSLPRVVALAGA